MFSQIFLSAPTSRGGYTSPALSCDSYPFVDLPPMDDCKQSSTHNKFIFSSPTVLKSIGHFYFPERRLKSNARTTSEHTNCSEKQRQFGCCRSCLSSRRKAVFRVRPEKQRPPQKAKRSGLHRNHASGKCSTRICRSSNALELCRGSGEAMELSACKAICDCPAERSSP